MKKHKEEKLGEIWIILSVVFQAFLPVGAHFGATQMPQIQFLAYVTLVSSFLYLPIAISKKEIGNIKNLKIFSSLLAYTLLVGVIPYGIIVYATRFSSAIETTLLMQSEVIFALIFGYFFLKEKISKYKLIGAFCILTANIILLYQNNLTWSWASIALFLAPTFFVVGNSISKKLQNEGISWSLILSFRSLIGGLILLATANQIEVLEVPNFKLISFIFLFAITVFGLGKIFWQLALHRLDLSKVTALGLSHPGISLFIAFIWLDEIPTSSQWLSIFIMGIGIFFLLKTNSRQWVELD